MKHAIYGAGNTGTLLYNAIQATERIDFFIDELTDKTEHCGLPVYRAKDAPKAQVYNSVYWQEKKVLQLLTNNGLDSVTFVDVINLYPKVIQEFQNEGNLWLQNDVALLDKDKLEKFASLLKDQKSIDTLNNIISFRTYLDATHYLAPNATLEEQYFCADIPILDNLDAVRFVDCGGFIGDTAKNLMQVAANKVEMVVSFEPDAGNLIKLNEEFQQQSKHHKNCRFLAYPAGVYSKNTILNFSENGSSSALSEEGELQIPVCSLDDTLFNMQPNYIKMDIEGAEKEALIGAEKIIRAFKPNLAICLYHKPQDLWELPLLINEFSDNYDMYLRVHNHLGVETVLYCINKGEQCD